MKKESYNFSKKFLKAFGGEDTDKIFDSVEKCDASTFTSRVKLKINKEIII